MQWLFNILLIVFAIGGPMFLYLYTTDPFFRYKFVLPSKRSKIKGYIIEKKIEKVEHEFQVTRRMKNRTPSFLENFIVIIKTDSFEREFLARKNLYKHIIPSKFVEIVYYKGYIFSCTEIEKEVAKELDFFEEYYKNHKEE